MTPEEQIKELRDKINYHSDRYILYDDQGRRSGFVSDRKRVHVS